MKYFEEFKSNTYAGSGNQLFFNMDENEIRTGRALYKISAGGKDNYSILFSNIIDSTYADGLIGHKNLICENWFIHSARIGRCAGVNTPENISELVMDDENENADIRVFDFKPISFNGQKTKEVMPGEFFVSDPIECIYEKDEYLCLEITFSGKMIPYHEESLIPVFVKEGHVFVLGDNRGRSKDSSIFGPVKNSALKGVVAFVVPYDSNLIEYLWNKIF